MAMITFWIEESEGHQVGGWSCPSCRELQNDAFSLLGKESNICEKCRHCGDVHLFPFEGAQIIADNPSIVDRRHPHSRVTLYQQHLFWVKRVLPPSLQKIALVSPDPRLALIPDLYLTFDSLGNPTLRTQILLTAVGGRIRSPKEKEELDFRLGIEVESTNIFRPRHFYPFGLKEELQSSFKGCVFLCLNHEREEVIVDPREN